MPATSTERPPTGEPPVAPRPDLYSFLGELLAEQQCLQTPVARFADQHATLVARHSSLHADLIPLTAPGPGEQYAFEVDLDACSGCKSCVAGCHSLNGLDAEETWRDVGLVLGGDAANPFQQTITSACHHCADPACANGCPVLAYEKDPATGIVRHLDDQCIGCSYCILKCPYDVPKYNDRLGIVRKCDMCHGRLAAGEAPACVQACPTHAIKITKVRVGRDASTRRPPNIEDATEHADASSTRPYPPAFLPASVAPDPAYTQPTTRYVTKRTMPANLRAADANALRPQPAHWPLALMLVLTQAGVGLSSAAAFVTYYVTFSPLAAPTFVTYYVTNTQGDATWVLAGLAGALTAAGLVASVAHLGQPLRAWRVFLGLRRSWLSREAVLLGGFFALLGATFLAPQPALWAATVSVGVLAVFCSIMIYVDTRRQFWRFALSALRMGGTVVVAALAFVAPWVAAFALGTKLALEGASLCGGSISARLQRGPLRRVVIARHALGTAAIGLFAAGWPAAALVVWLLGELAERHLYFRAVDAPKMPGMPASS